MKAGGKKRSHQRCGEAAVGLANDDKVAAFADGVDHRVGIVA
jgi:hypothetical protein